MGDVDTAMKVCNDVHDALRNGELNIDEVISLAVSMYVMAETTATGRGAEIGITKLEMRDNIKRLFEDRVYECRKYMERRAYGRR